MFNDKNERTMNLCVDFDSHFKTQESILKGPIPSVINLS